MTNRFCYKLLMLAALTVLGISCGKYRQTQMLNNLLFDEIINPYGAPKRNTAFPGTPLNINGQGFERGLGFHAPARLNIDLNGEGIAFEAWLGVDSAKNYYHSEAGLTMLCRQEKPFFPADYVYDNQADHDDVTQGGTIVLKVLCDGQETFNSGLMTANDSAQRIHLALKGVQTMTIIAESTNDGSYIDYVDLADASFTMRWGAEKLAIYNHPTDILVNHVGFHPEAPKTCYLHGNKDADFELIDIETQKVVFTGKMQHKPGNMGDYLVGDFSDFKTAGRYRLQANKSQSVIFRIDEQVLDDCLNKHLFYVSQKRSGHPTKGWRPGFHLDDGIRDDNGQHQNVVGGWDDACDQNKSSYSNTVILMALSELANAPSIHISPDSLIDEIKWGNDYLHKMQEPEGYLMSTVRHAKWTDNIIGNDDDRLITTAPTVQKKQPAYVYAEMLAYRYFSKHDSVYAQKCLNSAKRCYDYLTEHTELENSAEKIMMLRANCQYFQLTGDTIYRHRADELLRDILTQNYFDPKDSLTLFIRKSHERHKIFTINGIDCMNTYIHTFPNSPLADACKKTAKGYAYSLKRFCEQNAFHMAPWFIFDKKISSDKQLGNYYYRNFIHVGVNANLALKGNELYAAYLLSNNEAFIALAQRQLDWIYGANPFNSSTVMGLGYNQPVLFQAGESVFPAPRTPIIPGGVVTGFSSDNYDKMATYPAWWWTCEYWGVTNSAVIRLENALNNHYNKQAD